MKNRITLAVALLIGFLSWSQNGINYKAIIKDADGNAISNGNVTIQFSVLKGSFNQTLEYQESHNTTTDANGLIIRTIGDGTPITNTFSSIKWESDAHFLKVEVDTGSGLVDMGTTEFNAVPYALNVSGLEALDEGNGVGWRLKGINPNHYGDIGDSAVDLSHNGLNSSINGATGTLSLAMGSQTTASGFRSTAMGHFTTASGERSTATGASTEASGFASTAMGDATTASGSYSTAMGRLTIASGTRSTAIGSSTEASGGYSTAMGRQTTASGNISTAMGLNTVAPSGFEIAIGTYNTLYTPLSTSTFTFSDRLFVIGNGVSDSNRSDALIVQKNGKITAPSLSVFEIDDDKSLITKEFFDEKSALGLEQLDEGNGIGWRLKGRNSFAHGNIGDEAIDLSYSFITSSADPEARGATGDYSIATGYGTQANGQESTAMGRLSIASGNTSTAIGTQTQATGTSSTAMGFNTEASGLSAIAMGSNTVASGTQSTAMGRNTTASGRVSVAMGSNTIALSGYETVIGTYNKLYTPNSPTSFSSLDRLFVIGNGNSTSNRSNALTVRKNGNIGVGVDNPTVKLHVVSTAADDADLTNGKGSIVIGTINGENIAIDNNEIMARNNNGTNILSLQRNGGTVRVGNTIVHASDRRLKRDIVDLPYGLKEILQLQPKEYYWKNRTQDFKSLGLIAQEVLPIIANIVTIDNDKAKTLGVSYTELIPVLINAIKEQQDLINTLQSKVDSQQSLIKNQDSKMTELTAEFNQRLKQIERLLKLTTK